MKRYALEARGLAGSQPRLVVLRNQHVLNKGVSFCYASVSSSVKWVSDVTVHSFSELISLY